MREISIFAFYIFKITETIATFGCSKAWSIRSRMFSRPFFIVFFFFYPLLCIYKYNTFHSVIQTNDWYKPINILIKLFLFSLHWSIGLKIYIPLRNEQYVTQGQCLSGVLLVWIHIFSSHQLDAVPKLENPIFSTLYL